MTDGPMPAAAQANVEAPSGLAAELEATIQPMMRYSGETNCPATGWDEACALVLHARNVVLTTHAGPDGDGIGSMLGLSMALRAMGKTEAMVCADPVPPDLAFLPDAGRIHVLHDLKELPFVPDLVVVCDSASLPRLGAVYTAWESHFAALPILNLDHHRTNTRFGQVNLVDTTAAATVEIAHELLDRLQVELTQAAATALMTGLVTDTLGFRTESVTPRTLALAAQLLERGAPLDEISHRVFSATRYEKLRLWGYALTHLQRSEDGRIAWTVVPREVRTELGAKETDLMGLVSLIEGIEGADVAILAWNKRLDPLRTGISLRSRTVDVAAIAQALGGGGHAGAAGALLEDTPLNEGVRRAVESAKAHLD